MAARSTRTGTKTTAKAAAPAAAEAPPEPADEPGGARGAGLDGDSLAALRGHVVHVKDGALADASPSAPTAVAQFLTTADDVRRIVHEDLDAFVTKRREEGHDGPVPVLVWAHGGLVDKDAGFATADRQVQWWKDNGVYPIHVVWETGLWDAIKGAIGRGRSVGSRGFTDVTDRIVEVAARLLGGRSVWEEMKIDAAAASVPEGGAAVLARELRAYAIAQRGRISLHAAGHSAGSIFHSHFVPVLLPEQDAEGLEIATVTLLAPAVRIDTFENTLLPRAEQKSIRDLSIITMDDDHETRDSCVGVYRKSLLYLVSRAFEPEQEAAILGMDLHLRAAGRTRRYLDAGPERLVRGPISDGKRATTRAKSHGDFDNDAPTMQSLAYRVTGLGKVSDFPVTTREVEPEPKPEPVASSPDGARGAGARRALCIGVDAYPLDPLSGAVADAEAWAKTLDAAGFTTRVIRNQEATREAILGAMIDIVTTATAGDVIAIQFAGHGTFVRDLDGDEDAEHGPSDEALCPVDFREGRLIVDDDLAPIWDLIPDGVSVTLLFDCCHSGTASRGLERPEPTSANLPDGSVPRLAIMGDETGAKYRAKRGVTAENALEVAGRELVVQSETGRWANTTRNRPAVQRREILLSACQPDEVAYEKGGHGVFTTAALEIYGRTPELTNQEFVDAVVASLGESRNQTPGLTADEPLAARALFSSATGAVAPPPASGDAARAPEVGKRTAAIVAILRATADLLEEGGVD